MAKKQFATNLNESTIAKLKKLAIDKNTGVNELIEAMAFFMFSREEIDTILDEYKISKDRVND